MREQIFKRLPRRVIKHLPNFICLCLFLSVSLASFWGNVLTFNIFVQFYVHYAAGVLRSQRLPTVENLYFVKVADNGKCTQPPFVCNSLFAFILNGQQRSTCGDALRLPLALPLLSLALMRGGSVSSSKQMRPKQHQREIQFSLVKNGFTEATHSEGKCNLIRLSRRFDTHKINKTPTSLKLQRIKFHLI